MHHLNIYSPPSPISLVDSLSLERVGESNVRIVYTEDKSVQNHKNAESITNISLAEKNKLLVQAKQVIEESGFTWLNETILAYETLLLIVNDNNADYYSVVDDLRFLFSKHGELFNVSSEKSDWLNQVTNAQEKSARSQPHVIKVCYSLEDEEHPHDRDKIQQHSGLDNASIVRLHLESIYQVFAVGFMPNFAYLGEIDKQIHMPRLAEPRRKVPAGAVAIADGQTAVYPRVSPGGWHIIGYTPMDLSQQGDIQFKAGEQVKFEAISEEDFKTLSLDKRRGKRA